MYKTIKTSHHVRTTFGSWDVEKVYVVVAWSTFRSQKWKKLRGFGALLDVRSVAGARDSAQSEQNVKDLWQLQLPPPLHYTTLLYATTTSTTTTITTLHYTTLHQLHYTTLHQLHYTTLHYTTFHFTTLHCTTLNYTILRYNYNYNYNYNYCTLHYNTRRYTALHHTPLNSTPLHATPHRSAPLRSTPFHSTYNYNYIYIYITLHYATLHYTTLHYTTLHYTTLHYPTLHYTTPIAPPQFNCNYTTPQLQLHYITTTATAALHHATSSSCGWGDRPGDHCNHCNQPLQKTQLQPPCSPSVDSLCHPWSQRPSSPLGFLFWNFRQWHYWYSSNWKVAV